MERTGRKISPRTCFITVALLLVVSPSCGGDNNQTETSYPVSLSWVSEVTEPTEAADLPDIHYEKRNGEEWNEARWILEMSVAPGGEGFESVVLGAEVFQIPGSAGEITGEQGSWKSLASLTFWSELPEGEGTLRLALLDPGLDLPDYLEFRGKGQISDWLVAPIDNRGHDRQ